MYNNKLRPQNSNIKLTYTIKEDPEQSKKIAQFDNYENFGKWICRQFSKINIVYITDKEFW